MKKTMKKHDHEHDSEIMILRIDKGNKIVENIVKFCDDNQIDGAWISGLGAVSSATVGLYDLNTKEYHKKDLKGPFEIANLVGNVGTVKGKTRTHIHVVLTDGEMKAFGGHLDEAVVAATCEIKLEILEVEITRKRDQEIGLDLINLE